jgi:polar amino acid transport system substrate-binding protein
MVSKLQNLILILVLCLLGFSVPNLARENLDILTYASEPFIIINDGKYTGFSVDLMNEVSRELQFDYTFRQVKNVGHMLSEMKKNNSPLGISSVSITSEREQYIDFSHPYFNSGLDIMVRKESTNLFSFFRSFFMALFSESVIEAIIVVLVLLVFFAHCVWFFERRRNSERFPRAYFRGISEALWWAAVTVTTVGYGDKTPRSPIGRLMAVTWMFTGIFLISFFTATITSSLTVQQLRGNISGPEDLPGKRIGAVVGSTTEHYLNSVHAIPVTYKNLQAVFEGFENGEVDIVVYDAPLLKYYELTKGAGNATTLDTLFEKQDYGILFPQNSKYRDPINTAILKLKENGIYSSLLKKWFEQGF